MQASVEDGALAQCNVNEKQVQASVEVGKTSIVNFATIEVDLQNIIEMTAKYENVVLVPKLEEDEHVIGHVKIDVDDIFILTYNLFRKFVFVIP
jgi:hypothetical protein